MKAFEIDPDDPEAHRIMGAIKLVSEDYEQALYHHERARELCPSDVYIIARYSSVLICFSEFEKALSECSPDVVSINTYSELAAIQTREHRSYCACMRNGTCRDENQRPLADACT